MTSYIVLKQYGDRETWTQAGGPVEAVSAEAAIRKLLDGSGGVFVAIPLRSFKPLTVTVEAVQKVKIG